MTTRVLALLLDAINTRVVHWRVGARQPLVSRQELSGHLTRTPDPFMHVADRSRLTPTFIRRGPWGEEWHDEGGSEWRAERRAARGPSRASLVLLHGWLATRTQLELTARIVDPLRRHGIEVWTPWLPAHGPRTPPGSVSGARCLSSDLIGTSRALVTAVEETRALIDWLGRRSAPVGLWGVSLGGWVAALAACRSRPLQALLLWAPVADPLDALWCSPVAGDLRRSLRSGGVDRALLARAVAPLSPSERTCNTSPARTLVMCGAYDNVVSLESIDRLVQSWGVSARTYPHGHISMLWSRRARRDARARMQTLLVASESS